jgi:hypothetical protein
MIKDFDTVRFFRLVKEKIAKETKDREEAFKNMNENGEDQLLIDDFV